MNASNTAHTLSGIIASDGCAEGEAVLVLKQVAQNPTPKQPFVLVADLTTPDLIPLLVKASAIVTDIGGLSSHAASIARELGIPCIVSTGVATRRINSGDHVHVDADVNVITWNPRPDQCILCSKHPLLRVAESPWLFAIPDGYPIRRGHMLVYPKRHVERFGDLKREEVADLHEMGRALIEVVTQEVGFEGLNIGLNDGVCAGQTIAHVHFHFVPRHIGDTPNPRGGFRNFLPNPVSEY